MPRPRSVTFLALAVLLLGAFRLIGAVSALRAYDLLGQLPSSLPPAVLLVGNAVWAVVFIALGLGLWRLKMWARRGLLAAATLYLAQHWLERLLFARSDYARATIPFDLVLDGLSLALVWGALLRRRVRQCFSA